MANPYTYIRVQDASPVVLAILARWKVEIDPTIAQFVILDRNGRPVDWPLIESEREARQEVEAFWRVDRDDDGARSESVWQARMAGDMEVF
jgi:hypothetical protein